jgi:hydrogenase-4 component E
MSHSVPGFYDAATNAVAVLVLLIEFGMLRQALLRDQVRLYAFQSLVVTALALVVAFSRGVPELYAVAGFSFALKVVAVPWALSRLVRGTDTEIAGSGRFGLATQVLLAILAAGFGFFASGAFGIDSAVLPRSAFGLSVAVFLVGFVLMVVRGDVVSQSIGLFSLENGVSLASLVVAAGLPLILEVAFLFDLLVAVVVFGLLIRVHHRSAATLSTRSLTRLRG